MKVFSFSKKGAIIFSFLFLSAMLYAGGVLLSPRKVYVVKTNHFEIIFPKESSETAKYVAENADSLYEKAREQIELQNDFTMPIIISPDSSELDAKYTNQPYNRIVIYDSVPRNTEDAILNLLYREIFKAVSCSVRSPFNQFLHNFVLGNPYQPISFINLPFAFSQSYADISSACTNDCYYQQLLIQAKIEGKFPNWLQAAALRDIHPGNDLCHAAATGFSAYLIQSRGIEKYAEFWNECGKLHLFFMSGIFFKIYGERLSSVWKEFKEAVPLPDDLDKLRAFEELTHEVCKNDKQGAFENILYTNYGIVWYDSIRHEVDILDSNSVFDIRQLLFIAEEIDRLSLSFDGRYISATFKREKARKEFFEDVTRVFDLKERKFLNQKFSLRESCLAVDAQGKMCIAGISVEEKYPVLQIYSFLPNEKDFSLIYEKHFKKSEIVSNLNIAGYGKISYLISDSNGQNNLEIQSFDNSNIEALSWKILDFQGNQIIPQNIQFINGKNPLLSFSYIPEHEGQLSRSGYITLNWEYGILTPKEVYIQNCDISGGVYYPLYVNNYLYYSAKKFSHNELRYVSKDLLSFEQGSIEKIQKEKKEFESELVPQEMPKVFDPKEQILGNFNLRRYNPFKYMLKISYNPFLAVRDINLDNGPVFWPSLGVYINADADPMRNTELIISGAYNFLNLSFEKEINIVPKETMERFNEIFGEIKTFTFATYLKNSSTPVDISAGALFNFNVEGDYDFKAIAKTAWHVPVGTILRNMEFSISSIYFSSTDYYDENKVEYHPPMKGWTPLGQAYELLEVSAMAKYSNSHQYGISQYERRGLTAGCRLFSRWDIYEINQLKKYRDDALKQIDSGINTELTKVQVENLYKKNLLDISQLNVGFFAEIEIPRLTPLEITNGWVLSLPSIVRAELLNKTGTALEVNIESLLIGNEIQNGLPFLYLFFSRIGLKFGYNFTLDYDTTKVQLPDIRRDKYFGDVFTHTYFSDSIYLKFNTDFLFPTGKLSEIKFNLNMSGEYFIKTNGFKFSFNIDALF